MTPKSLTAPIRTAELQALKVGTGYRFSSPAAVGTRSADSIPSSSSLVQSQQLIQAQREKPLTLSLGRLRREVETVAGSPEDSPS